MPAARRLSVVPAATLVLCAGAACRPAAPEPDPLQSWHDGATKASIVAFVRAVSDTASPQYVPPARRIAAFDNDGTLWNEKPLYVQLAFALDRVKALAPQHPEWSGRMPYRAILDNDLGALRSVDEQQIVELVMATHAGGTRETFDSIATAWLAAWRHPQYGRGVEGLVYTPMIELLDYLRANGFTTFIVTGGGIDFVRTVSERLYGIPPWQVIGSTIEYRYDTLAARIVRRDGIALVDDQAGKPVGIQQHIGLRPIFVAGNSDGDRQMMAYSAAVRPSLQVLVHHDDAEREYVYDRGIEVTLAEAPARGFVVISMKNDWRKVFP